MSTDSQFFSDQTLSKSMIKALVFHLLCLGMCINMGQS